MGSHHFVKGASSTVLVPQPSDDPSDPLNWSIGWKISAITASSYVTFCQGFGPLALAPMFGDYIEAFDCTLAQAIQFTGVCILVLGFSNFLWYDTPGYDQLDDADICKGSYQHFFWQKTSTILFKHYVYGLMHLASQGADIWQLHGSLCCERPWSWTRRNNPTGCHR